MTWKDISEAPKNGTQIIILMDDYKNSNDDVTCVRWYSEDEDGEAGWYDNYGVIFNPKYWLPMPEKPVKKHCCFNDMFKCVDDKNRKFLLMMKRFDDDNNYLGFFPLEHISYCPFCGANANEYY